MTIDINELRQLAQAVSEWSNCNQAWLEQSEDIHAAVVGHIDEDGNTYPVATIDCDQYYAAHQSLPLARFYAAAASPTAIIELLDRLEAAESEALEQARLNGMGGERELALMAKLEAAEKERDALRAKMAEVEKQEPVAEHEERDSYPEGAYLVICHPGGTLRRFRIAAAEQQEPVAFALYGGESLKSVYLTESEACDQRDRRQLSADIGGSLEAYRVVPLCRAPGAKGDEK